MQSDKQQVFRILRFFSFSSLISLIVAALLLTWLYRHVAVSGIVSSGEHSNLMLSQSMLNAMQPELSAYLADEMLHHSQPLPGELADEVLRLIARTSVRRVQIIDDEGIVVFSTDPSQIGSYQGKNASFFAAQQGQVVSKLNQHDGVTLLPSANSDTSLINSYIPIHAEHLNTIEGVFAVETDVRPLMSEIEKTELQVFFASIGIMLLLYLVLIAIVRHAERLITRQETMLRERSHALEMLSSQLITVQENEKKRVAEELHEGVAQTLSSVKFRLEHARGLLKRHETGSEASLEQLVPLVQDAIREVRTLAMDIRPPSLDEIGVIGTLKWYSNELVAVYPNLALEREVMLEEEDIPKPLKVVLYRSLQQLLQPLAHTELAMRVRVTLSKEGDAIWLKVMDDHPLVAMDAGHHDEHKRQQVTLREFVALSGGVMTVNEPNDWGGSTAQVGWPL